MSAIDIIAGVTVEVGFGVDAVGGSYFVLDDPVKGKLNDATYLLAPETVFVDLSSHVAEIQTSRGRDRELDEYGAGTATVLFNDDDRTFDPAYSGSPYFGQITPMRRIKIKYQAEELFTGWVSDWSVTYEPGDNLSRVTASCVDAFAILANQELLTLAASYSGDLSGARVSRVLNLTEVDFPAARSIDAGLSTFGATTLGTNALSYLQDCARAEAGYFFVAADGTLTFRQRTATLNASAGVVFSDDPPTGIPYLSVTQRSSADLLYSRVTGESETTANPLEAVNEAAKDEFLTRTLDLGTLFTINDAETQGIIDYYLERFSSVELRFQSATVNLGALTAAEVTNAVALDLTDVVSVERSPLGVGATIERLSIVDGIRHQITPGDWTVEFSFSNADTRSFLILDDPVFGVLGANRLAF